MNLVRFSPYRDVSVLQNRMNGLFEEALQGLTERNGSVAWLPPADIYETENELVVSADLPGVDPKQIDVRVESNVLTIRGQRSLSPKVQNENFHRVERTYGSFLRSFALSSAVDADRIRATYNDGVLQVTLPKAEKAKPRKIQIAAATA